MSLVPATRHLFAQYRWSQGTSRSDLGRQVLGFLFSYYHLLRVQGSGTLVFTSSQIMEFSCGSPVCFMALSGHDTRVPLYHGEEGQLSNYLIISV